MHINHRWPTTPKIRFPTCPAYQNMTFSPISYNDFEGFFLSCTTAIKMVKLFENCSILGMAKDRPLPTILLRPYTQLVYIQKIVHTANFSAQL